MRNDEPQETEGRVLRFKEGYNPNSSSVGSAIPVFLVAAFGAGTLTVFLLNMLGSIKAMVSKQKLEPHGQAAPGANAPNGEDDGT